MSNKYLNCHPKKQSEHQKKLVKSDISNLLHTQNTPHTLKLGFTASKDWREKIESRENGFARQGSGDAASASSKQPRRPAHRQRRRWWSWWRQRLRTRRGSPRSASVFSLRPIPRQPWFALIFIPFAYYVSMFESFIKYRQFVLQFRASINYTHVIDLFAFMFDITCVMLVYVCIIYIELLSSAS